MNIRQKFRRGATTVAAVYFALVLDTFERFTSFVK